MPLNHGNLWTTDICGCQAFYAFDDKVKDGEHVYMNPAMAVKFHEKLIKEQLDKLCWYSL